MIAVYAALFGLAFGSFVNAAIDRIPRGRSLNGGSRCDSCGIALKPLQLIPIASYLIQRGRCVACRAPIGARTPIVETGFAIVFVTLFETLPLAFAAPAAAAFIAAIIGAGAALRKRSLQP